MNTEENMVLCAALEYWKARQKISPSGSATDAIWDDIEEKEQALKEAIDQWAPALNGGGGNG